MVKIKKLSNIGKEKILIPREVTVRHFGWKLFLSSEYGSFSITLPSTTRVVLTKNSVRLVSPGIKSALSGSLQRKLTRIIDNLFMETIVFLQLVGSNYRARIENNVIIIRLGYSHEINVDIPSNLNVTVIKRNSIRIAGLISEEVLQYAYRLRSFRKPEPFKGKGVVLVGEVVRRKEGKKKKL